VPRACPSRILVAALVLLTASTSSLLAEDGSKSSKASVAPYILVGFVGGFVHHDDIHHGPVILAQRLRQNARENTYIQVFENRRRKEAYATILRLLDSDRDGVLSQHEKSQAHIVLFGQSWGASAVVLLARELERVGVPVLLTVQVDSVAKPWQQDGIIPENVAAAVNFYQRQGLVHGRAEIRAADESKTQILGNFRFVYHGTAPCPGIPWVERTFVPGHIFSECDPNLWGQVESVVRQHMEPESHDLAVAPQP